MSYKQQLKKGVRVESEHKNTVEYIEKYKLKTGKIPSNKKVYESIAKDHLKEDLNYYDKLKKANL